MFSSYGVEYDKRPGWGESFQKNSSPENQFAYSQHNDRDRQEFSHNFTVGLDYFLNDKTSVTGSFLYNTGEGLNTAETNYTDFDENGAVIRSVKRTERENEDEENIETTLNFKRTLNEKADTDGRF